MRRWSASLVLVGALVLAGCTGDDRAPAPSGATTGSSSDAGVTTGATEPTADAVVVTREFLGAEVEGDCRKDG